VGRIVAHLADTARSLSRAGAAGAARGGRQSYGQRVVRPGSANLVYTTQPLFSAFFAAMLLDEQARSTCSRDHVAQGMGVLITKK
jgi:hypothetical protein